MTYFWIYMSGAYLGIAITELLYGNRITCAVACVFALGTGMAV